MARAVDIAGHGSGFTLGQGLLGSLAQGRLPLGVARAAPVRWAAHVLIVSVVTLWLAWVGALFLDARAGQGSWLTVALVAMGGVPWLSMVWRLWRGLASGRSLTLMWGGQPSRKPSAERGAQRGAPQALPGWSVHEWRQAVSVHVVFDLGAWVLVKVIGRQGAQPRATAWSWLNARQAFRGAAGHHWRALMFNCHANDVGALQAPPADITAVVASCGHTQRRWTNLLSSFKTTGQNTGPGAIRREAGAPHATMAGDDFAPTQWLEPTHRPGQGRGS